MVADAPALELRGLTKRYDTGLVAVENFDLTIPDEEAEKLKTVGEAIDYILKHLTVKS